MARGRELCAPKEETRVDTNGGGSTRVSTGNVARTLSDRARIVLAVRGGCRTRAFHRAERRATRIRAAPRRVRQRASLTRKRQHARWFEVGAHQSRRGQRGRRGRSTTRTHRPGRGGGARECSVAKTSLLETRPRLRPTPRNGRGQGRARRTRVHLKTNAGDASPTYRSSPRPTTSLQGNVFAVNAPSPGRIRGEVPP